MNFTKFFKTAFLQNTSRRLLLPLDHLFQRSSRWQMFYKIGVLRLQPSCFPVNIATFLRTPFFTEHLLWLLLNVKTTFSRLSNVY